MCSSFLFSYDEIYVPKVDVERMIGVKKSIYNFSKKKLKEIVFINFVSRIKKGAKRGSEESCHGVGVAMCCSLNCYQDFPHQIT